MATAQDLIARAIASVKAEFPDWDLSPGTIDYAFIEAMGLMGESLAYTSVLNEFSTDPDTLSGESLDAFMRLFGFFRGPATTAIGTVTLSRGTPADQDYIISHGAQLAVPATQASPTVYFRTTTTVTLEQGKYSVEVPVEAMAPGSLGNVPAGSITVIAAGIIGPTAVDNAVATTGGSDGETDDEFRAKWRSQNFRNVSRTVDFYEGIATRDRSVTRANAVGPQTTYYEQLTVSSGAATSQNTESKYTYDRSGVVGYAIGQADEQLGVQAPVGVPSGNDWSMNTATPPVFTINDSTLFPNGTVVEFEHDYTPSASRCDPSTGFLDAIDIFIAGEDPIRITEELVMSRAAQVTWGVGGSNIDRTKWRRADGTTQPTNGNFLMELNRQPVVSVPAKITVGSTVYEKDTDYWIVHDNVVATRRSVRAHDGIEWASGSCPTDGTSVEAEYSYNAAVERVQANVDLVRGISDDVLVHRAVFRRLRFNLAVVLTRTGSLALVESSMSAALAQWLNGKDFRDNVQISDVIEVAGSVAGVDNVRLVTSTEAVNEVQKLTFSGMASGTDTFRLKIGTETTGAINYNSTLGTLATSIATALANLTYIDSSDITVDTSGGGVRVAFPSNTDTVVSSPNRWGHRALDLIQPVNISAGTIVVTRLKHGQGYGIETVQEDGITINDPPATADFAVRSETIATFDSVVLMQRAPNTF